MYRDTVINDHLIKTASLPKAGLTTRPSPTALLLASIIETAIQLSSLYIDVKIRELY